MDRDWLNDTLIDFKNDFNSCGEQNKDYKEVIEEYIDIIEEKEKEKTKAMEGKLEEIRGEFKEMEYILLKDDSPDLVMENTLRKIKEILNSQKEG